MSLEPSAEAREQARQIAESLKTQYCKHWNGHYCEICAAVLIARALAEKDAKLAEAKRERAELPLLGLCVYCGLQEKFQTPEAMVDGMRAHVPACSARPERALEADLAAMRGALEKNLATFRDFEIGNRMLRRDTMADAARVAEEATASVLASSPGAAWLETARELVEALAVFAHAPESDGWTTTFLVTGRDVNRARALLARPGVQEMAGGGQ